MLDLSKLEEVTQTSDGKPVLFDISEVMEDPNQPRQEFEETSLRELAENIKARGIKSPISVKPRNVEGKYIINHGARRYRAAILAGLERIPAFIDGEHGDYDQIAENIHRENLTPLEIALFIKKRLSVGDKKADIARRLNRDRAFVTQHAALIDPPEFLLSLYRSGKCGSAVHLYELRNLYETHGEEVVGWCEKVAEITRKGIIALKDSLNGGDKQDRSQLGEGKETEKVEAQRAENRGQNKDLSTKTVEDTKQPNKANGVDRIRKPLLLVRHDKKSASIVLDRKPSAEGLVFICYEEGNARDALEVPVSSVKLERLLDASEG